MTNAPQNAKLALKIETINDDILVTSYWIMIIFPIDISNGKHENLSVIELFLSAKTFQGLVRRKDKEILILQDAVCESDV